MSGRTPEAALRQIVAGVPMPAQRPPRAPRTDPEGTRHARGTLGTDHPRTGVPRRGGHRVRVRAVPRPRRAGPGRRAADPAAAGHRVVPRAAAATGSAWSARSPRPRSSPASRPACSSTSPTTAGCRPGCCCSRTRSPTSSAPGPASWSTGWARSGSAASATSCAPTCAGKFDVGPMKVRLERPVRHGGAGPHLPEHAPRWWSPRGSSRSRGAAVGRLDRLRATTGPARSPAAAPRTSPCASTAAATTCAGCTGAAAPTPAS